MSADPASLRGRAVMVTGGCGFIGTHLVARLLALGAARVVVVDHLRHGRERPPWIENPAVRLVRHGIGFDPPGDLAPELAGIDVLAHLAAEKHNQALDRPDDLLLSNVVGTRRLFDDAADAGVGAIVFSSSLYACGRVAGGAMREDEVARPATVYGASKLCGEHLLAHTAGRTGVEAVSLRYFFAYGPGQGLAGGYRSVIPVNFERIARGAPPRIHGDGRQALDYVYVDDIVEATVRAMAGRGLPSPINVASGEATSIADLTDAMLAAAGSPLRPEHGPPDWTAGTERYGATERAEASLGWRVATPLEEGLRRVWRADYREEDRR